MVFFVFFLTNFLWVAFYTFNILRMKKSHVYSLFFFHCLWRKKSKKISSSKLFRQAGFNWIYWNYIVYKCYLVWCFVMNTVEFQYLPDKCLVWCRKLFLQPCTCTQKWWVYCCFKSNMSSVFFNKKIVNQIAMMKTYFYFSNHPELY